MLARKPRPPQPVFHRSGMWAAVGIARDLVAGATCTAGAAFSAVVEAAERAAGYDLTRQEPGSAR